MTDNFKYWRLCAWAGPTFLLAFMIGWGALGGNIPPTSAALSADEIAAHFRDNYMSIRLGMAICMSLAVLYLVWGVAIFKVLQKMEGDNQVMSHLQLWGAGLTVVPVLVSCSFWMTAAFRPDTDPNILRMLLDMAWLLIDMAYAVTSMQMIAMAVVFLSDKRERPLVPKFVAWYGIWVAVMFVAECFIPYFKDGPFSRSGLLNFWIEFAIWFVWIPMQSYYTFVAINRLEQEETKQAATPVAAPRSVRGLAPST